MRDKNVWSASSLAPRWRGRVGPIWGFGDGQELRNMFMRTPQPGLWFIAGSFAQCRIYSKYLGLQIKACELGLLRESRDAADERATGDLAAVREDPARVP